MPGDKLMSTPEIPFELVDDDEMAAIDAAFLHAYTVSYSHQAALLRRPAEDGTGSFLYYRHNGAAVGTSILDEFGKAMVRRCSAQLNSSGGIDSLSSNGEVSSLAFPSEDADVFSSHGGSPQIAASSVMTQMTTNDDADQVESSGVSATGLMLSQWDPGWPSSGSSQNSVLEAGISIQPSARKTSVGGMKDIEDFSKMNKETSQRNMFEDAAAGLIKGVPILRHRSRRALSVTDFTASEWCEKQIEFSMTRGKPVKTVAMKAGSARHLELEVEVVSRVEIEIQSKEDSWAIRLLNFITGARQLLSEGLTRELPVMGLLLDTWVVGIIDEIFLADIDGVKQPLLIDTKTRMRRTPPSEPQKRNARLQLMIYKLLWDGMVQADIPSKSFFDHFALKPHKGFSQDVKSHIGALFPGSEVECLRDLIPLVVNEFRSLPVSSDSLVIRYEWQADHSLLGEEEFSFEHEWVMDRLRWHMEFWRGYREASLVPDEEKWKCRHCSFAQVCTEFQTEKFEKSRLRNEKQIDP